MKSNIDIVSGPNNILYLKFGEKIMQLKGVDCKNIEKIFFEIKENNLFSEDIKEKQDFIELLSKIGAFEKLSSFGDILTSQGISNNLSKKIKIGVLGDADLVEKVTQEYTNLHMKKLDIKTVELHVDEYDFGIIVARKYNAKKWLEMNAKFFINNKVFYPILFEETAFTIGPQVIPHHTSCTNCMRIHELENNYYGEIIGRFDQLDTESTEFIPDELVNLAFSFVRNQLIKDSLLENGTAIEPELAQKIYSYQFLDGIWKEHNLLKSPKCKLCFPNSINDGQIFEVQN